MSKLAQAIVLFQAVLFSSTLFADPKFKRGDTNADGAVNITDLSNWPNFVYNGTYEARCYDAIDIDNNGQFDTTDFCRLTTYVGGGFCPGLSPTCIDDRDGSNQPDTSDELGCNKPSSGCGSGVGVKDEFIRGDVNGDGCVDVSDASALNDHLTNGTVDTMPCLDAADANNDSVINCYDSCRIVQALLGGNCSGNPCASAGTLSPYPSCGRGLEDSSADGLGCNTHPDCTCL